MTPQNRRKICKVCKFVVRDPDCEIIILAIKKNARTVKGHPIKDFNKE